MLFSSINSHHLRPTRMGIIFTTCLGCVFALPGIVQATPVEEVFSSSNGPDGTVGRLCSDTFIGSRHVLVTTPLEITTDGVIREPPAIYHALTQSKVADLALISISKETMSQCLTTIKLPSLAEFTQTPLITYTIQTRRDSDYAGLNHEEINRRGYSDIINRIQFNVSNTFIYSDQKLFILGATKPTNAIHIREGASGSTGDLSTGGLHFSLAKTFGVKKRYSLQNIIINGFTTEAYTPDVNGTLNIVGIMGLAGLRYDYMPIGLVPIAQETMPQADAE
jgi:hypothetical protein